MAERLTSYSISNIHISSVSVAELRYGVYKSQRSESNAGALLKFLSPFNSIPFTESEGKVCGEVRSTLQKSGNIIGSYDLMIGPQALANDLTLVTNNEKEFRRISNLRIENWALA